MNIQTLKENKIINQLIEESLTSQTPITDEVLEDKFIVLQEFVMDYLECQPGMLSQCKQKIKGRQMNLTYKNANFYPSVIYCAHYEYENKFAVIKNNYIYTDFNIDRYPNTIKQYLNNLKVENFFNEDEAKERSKLINVAGKAIVDYIEQKKQLDPKIIKGIYIDGVPGIGKTTIMRALANEGAKRAQKIFFCTSSDIIEKCKEQFSRTNGTSINFIDQMKKADILFIDDFAGEMVSTWSRDNLWFSVLNYRMNKNKLTYLSSNFSLNELEKVYFIKTNSKDLENKKIIRLKERITSLVSFYTLSGNTSKRK